MEGATFRCCNQISQRYKVQHQERIDRSLDDGLKDLMMVSRFNHQRRSSMVLPKQHLAVKLRSVIGFKDNPIHLIHKRLS
jgi:hypothetical protein